MLLTTDKKVNLDKKEISDSEEIKIAADLLYEIINHSYQCSGTCLETYFNEQRFDIQSLYWECKNNLNKIEKGGEKTAFLGMSVLEDTFKKVLPLLLVPVQEIAAGNLYQSECVNKLQKVFANNEYKNLWEEKAEKYRALIHSLGLSLEYSDYEDLTLIMEPLLNAFLFYEGEPGAYPPAIYEVRSGKKSTAVPEIMTTVYKFSSEKEFTDFIMGCGKESVIAFGAIEKINRQVKDYFHDYLKGGPDEYIYNITHNKNKTEEEILEETCDSSRVIYLGVKSGETMWIVKMPYKTESYLLKELSDRYYYGTRAGYAPYEVFFQDITAQPEGTTFLSVKYNGYRLNDIMDDQQKIWLPVFLEETMERFFRQDLKTEILFFPEEMVAYAGKNEIVPAYVNVPCVKSLSYDVPDPETIFADDKEMMTLIRYFNVGIEDIKDAPLIPNKCLVEADALQDIQKKVRAAYIRKTADYILDLLKSKSATRIYVLQCLVNRMDVIIENAKEGMYIGFMEIVTEGISVNDYKVRSLFELQQHFLPYVTWYGETASKAGVIYKISPVTGEEYALLLGKEKEELPDILKLSKEIRWFWDKHRRNLPSNMNSKYGECSIFLHDMANINICMRKKTFKKYKGDTL